LETEDEYFDYTEKDMVCGKCMVLIFPMRYWKNFITKTH